MRREKGLRGGRPNDLVPSRCQGGLEYPFVGFAHPNDGSYIGHRLGPDSPRTRRVRVPDVRTLEGHVLAVYFQCVEPAWIVLGYVNQPFVFPGRMIPDQDQAGFARRFEISAEPSNLFLRAQPTVLVKYSSWKGIDLETFECTCKSIASCKTVTLLRVFPAAQLALPTKAGIHPFMLSHSTTST